MQEYTITYISQFKTNKDGQPYLTKGKNEPFVRVSLKVAEHGESYVSGLWFGVECPWKVGDKQKLVITKEMYNGVEQLKFEIPKAKSINNELLEKVYGNQLLIIEEVKHLKSYLVAKFGVAEAPKDPNMPEYPENNLEPTI